MSRSQLYGMIWAEPTRTVALRFGVSGVALAKMCRKYYVPRPWRGYWREKETGKKPRQPKLPPWPKHLGPEPDTIPFRKARPPGDDAPPRPPEPETVQAQRAYEDAPAHRIVVGPALLDPDRLVRRADRLIRRKSNEGILGPREWPCLDIHVSHDALDRALRIIDAVIKAVRVRGWTVETQTESQHPTLVTVLDEDIAVTLTERTQRIENPTPWLDTLLHTYHLRYRFEPTGSLTLTLTTTQFGQHARSWNDGKTQRLDRCLNEVMLAFVEQAERQKADRRTHEAWERQRAEEERRRFARFEQQEREKERQDELKRQLDRWRSAEDVRAYLHALQTAALETVAAAPDGRLARWIRWVEDYVERLDPLNDIERLPADPEGYYRKPLDLDAFAMVPGPEPAPPGEATAY